VATVSSHDSRRAEVSREETEKRIKARHVRGGGGYMRSAWSEGGELVGSAGVRWQAADCATAAWARVVWDTQPWGSVDGLVASSPNRRRVVLCSGPGPISLFKKLKYFPIAFK
jgi:hypothetical protein